MPLLQYHCARCNIAFDRIVKKYDDKVMCPKCGQEAARLYSGTMYSQTGKPVKHCSGNCKNCSGCH